MGWSFRKSKKFGPFRLNMSKSGVGVSVGVKGARVSAGPRGTRLNLEKYGIRYSTSLSGGHHRTASAPSLQIASQSSSLPIQNIMLVIFGGQKPCDNCSQMDGIVWLPAVVEAVTGCGSPEACTGRVVTVDLVKTGLLSVLALIESRGGCLSREEFLELCAIPDLGVGIDYCQGCAQYSLFIHSVCAVCCYSNLRFSAPSIAVPPPPVSAPQPPPSQKQHARAETKLGTFGANIGKKSGLVDLDFILDNQTGPELRLYTYYSSGNAKGHFISLCPADYDALRETLFSVADQLAVWLKEGRIDEIAISASDSLLKLDYQIQIPFQVGYISSSLALTENRAAYYSMYFQETGDRRKSGVLVYFDQAEFQAVVEAINRAGELFYSDNDVQK